MLNHPRNPPLIPSRFLRMLSILNATDLQSISITTGPSSVAVELSRRRPSSSSSSCVSPAFGRAILRGRGFSSAFSHLILTALQICQHKSGASGASVEWLRTLIARYCFWSCLNSSGLRVVMSRSSSGGGVGVRGMMSMDLSASC